MAFNIKSGTTNSLTSLAGEGSFTPSSFNLTACFM
jgi:hypothetical protein